MGMKCAPLIADLLLYCYESHFMTKQDPSKLSLIGLFNNNCRYLNDILTVNNPNFLMLVKHFYPQELTLNKANITRDFSQFFLFRHIPF